MIELTELQERVHRKVLLLRQVEHLISGEKFKRVWDDATNKERVTLQNMIQFKLIKDIRIFLVQHSSFDLAEKSVAELKRLAKLRCIPHYSRMLRTELMKALEGKRI